MKTQNQEICANCGHKRENHGAGGFRCHGNWNEELGIAEQCFCKKFVPQKWKPEVLKAIKSISQNHSQADVNMHTEKSEVEMVKHSP